VGAGSDLHSWHPQGERFGAGDEKRGVTAIIGRNYPTIDLTAKRVANRLNDRGFEATTRRENPSGTSPDATRAVAGSRLANEHRGESRRRIPSFLKERPEIRFVSLALEAASLSLYPTSPLLPRLSSRLSQVHS